MSDEYQDIGIPGWMTQEELTWLMRTARAMHTIIEVGCWKGRSTHALLTGLDGRGLLTAVDHFQGNPADAPADFINVDPAQVYGEFIKNVGARSNLSVVPLSSASAVGVVDSADCVFLDGPHDYENVRDDIARWGPKAKKLLCGHDYCHGWSGVVRAVDEAFGKPDGVCGSIWWIDVAKRSAAAGQR